MLRFNFHWTDYEVLQAKHMQETFRAIIETMGGQPMAAMPGPIRLRADGRRAHHPRDRCDAAWGTKPRRPWSTPTARPTTSSNVFVADGGPFVSQPDKNPTWTILALAWRTSDYILAQRKEGSHLMATINRRRVLQLLGSAPLAAGSSGPTRRSSRRGSRRSTARRAPVYKPSFFTPHEFATAALLAEIVIPEG